MDIFDGNFFTHFFTEIDKTVHSVDLGLLDKTVDLIRESSQKNGKIIVAGNGGSAAMASHVAVDLTKSAKIRAVNFNEADLLTCLANDYGYEHWVSRAIEFYSDPSDLLILISSSGTSRNIVNGGRTAREMGLKLITFSGINPGNPLQQIGNINFYADNKGYNIVEMTHHIWLLAIVDKIIGKIEYSANDKQD